MSVVYDDDRRQDVVHFSHPSTASNRFDSGISPVAQERVISLWHRRDDAGGNERIVLSVETSEGSRLVNYRYASGTDNYNSGAGEYNIHLDLPTGSWNRIEQDVAADIERLTSGVDYVETTGIWLWGMDFKLGEVRFSNAMTTTRNSLMPGSFGQIAYRETWSGTGGSPTPMYGGTARGGGERRWLSYNHIGNVVNTSDDAGALVEAIDTDAYGNPLANVMTGAWGSSLSERGLTTKELDPAAGMYYFYQRWYDPQTATFASRAPYAPDIEHGWGYGESSPLNMVDPSGENPALIAAALGICGTVCAASAIRGNAQRACGTCITSCMTAVGGAVAGPGGAVIGGAVIAQGLVDCFCYGDCPCPPDVSNTPQNNPTWPFPMPNPTHPHP